MLISTFHFLVFVDFVENDAFKDQYRTSLGHFNRLGDPYIPLTAKQNNKDLIEYR